MCLECTEDRATPCGHLLCGTCAEKWNACGKNTCPTCRAPIVTVAPASNKRRGRTITIVFGRAQRSHHVGITLTGSVVHTGVAIRALEPNDLAYRSGLRTGDVITHINSMVVTDHSTAIAVIETARRHGLPIQLNVRRPWRLSSLRRFRGVDGR